MYRDFLLDSVEIIDSQVLMLLISPVTSSANEYRAVIFLQTINAANVCDLRMEWMYQEQ